MILEWIVGSHAPAGIGGGFSWLLAHCTDGVIWGRLPAESNSWLLASAVFPDVSPSISESNLLELRLFGEKKEILMWKNDGVLAGRLIDDKEDVKDDYPTKPHVEDRILLGDRLRAGPKGGFSLVGSADGKQQTVPIECSEQDFRNGRWPLRLRVRHYFEQDPNTGVVRVAAGRLVSVFKETS